MIPLTNHHLWWGRSEVVIIYPYIYICMYIKYGLHTVKYLFTQHNITIHNILMWYAVGDQRWGNVVTRIAGSTWRPVPMFGTRKLFVQTMIQWWNIATLLVLPANCRPYQNVSKPWKHICSKEHDSGWPACSMEPGCTAEGPVSIGKRCKIAKTRI